MKFKKILLGLSIFGLAVILGGCGSNNNKNKTNTTQGGKTEEEVKEEIKEEKKEESTETLKSLVTQGEVKNQFEKPSKGENIANIYIKNFGKIRCRLFSDVAPIAVRNFIEFAKKGLYNNSTFHRVIKDFMIQAGKEADIAMEKEGGLKRSQVELNKSVRHYNGALCMARSNNKVNGQGCQFYIVQSDQGKTGDLDAIADKTNAALKLEGYDIHNEYDEETKKLYKEHGGRPDLDMNYTVFGQVFEGQDIVKKISEVPKKIKEETDKEAEPDSVPKEPVVIEKIEISTME